MWLLAAFLAAGGTSRAAGADAKTPRLTLAVLTFEDQTADPEAAHWRYTIARLLGEQLAEARALRRVPAAFGYRQLNVKQGDPMSCSPWLAFERDGHGALAETWRERTKENRDGGGHRNLGPTTAEQSTLPLQWL